MYWLIAPSSFSSHCTYVIEQQTLYTTKKREMIIIFLWENVWHNFFYALIFCWEKKNMFAAKVPIIFTQLWSLARWVSTISQNNFFFIFPKKIFRLWKWNVSKKSTTVKLIHFIWRVFFSLIFVEKKICLQVPTVYSIVVSKMIQHNLLQYCWLI